MSILNLGKFINTLSQMQTVIETESETTANNGWKSTRTHLLSNRHNQFQSSTNKPTILSNGDGVLKTVDIAQEVIHETLSRHALTGVNNLWHDGQVHRALNPNLKMVRTILLDAFARISAGKTANLTSYLLHVNDANVNTSMVSPHGRGFSYFASQMCIIDPEGKAHFLSMDRVRNTGGNGVGYIWRALSVDAKYEVSMQRRTPNGSISYELAGAYVEVEGLKIPIFTRPFNSVGLDQNSDAEYAYREIQLVKKAVSSVRPFHRHE